MTASRTDPEEISQRIQEALRRDEVAVETVRDLLLDCFKEAYLLKLREGDLVLQRQHPAKPRSIIDDYDDPELALEEIEKRYRDLFVYLGASWENPSRQSLGTIVELLDRAVFDIEPEEEPDDPTLAKHSQVCDKLLERVT